MKNKKIRELEKILKYEQEQKKSILEKTLLLLSNNKGELSYPKTFGFLSIAMPTYFVTASKILDMDVDTSKSSLVLTSILIIGSSYFVKTIGTEFLEFERERRSHTSNIKTYKIKKLLEENPRLNAQIGECGDAIKSLYDKNLSYPFWKNVYDKLIDIKLDTELKQSYKYSKNVILK